MEQHKQIKTDHNKIEIQTEPKEKMEKEINSEKKNRQTVKIHTCGGAKQTNGTQSIQKET